MFYITITMIHDHIYPMTPRFNPVTPAWASAENLAQHQPYTLLWRAHSGYKILFIVIIFEVNAPGWMLMFVFDASLADQR